MPTGAASAGLCRDSPVRKLVRAASRTRMDTDTQRVLLALEKEALKWDAHVDTKLYLGRTGKHRALQCFFKTCNSSHPTPKSLKANEIPQTFSRVTGCYCFGSCAGGASVLGLRQSRKQILDKLTQLTSPSLLLVPHTASEEDSQKLPCKSSKKSCL